MKLLLVLTIFAIQSSFAHDSDSVKKWLKSQCGDCKEFTSEYIQKLNGSSQGYAVVGVGSGMTNSGGYRGAGPEMVGGIMGGSVTHLSPFYSSRLSLQERNSLPAFKQTPVINFKIDNEIVEGHVLSMNEETVELMGLRKIDKKDPFKVHAFTYGYDEANSGKSEDIANKICQGLGEDFRSDGSSAGPSEKTEWVKGGANSYTPSEYQIASVSCKRTSKSIWKFLTGKIKSVYHINDDERSPKEVEEFQKPSNSKSSGASKQ